MKVIWNPLIHFGIKKILYEQSINFLFLSTAPIIYSIAIPRRSQVPLIGKKIRDSIKIVKLRFLSKKSQYQFFPYPTLQPLTNMKKLTPRTQNGL